MDGAPWLRRRQRASATAKSEASATGVEGFELGLEAVGEEGGEAGGEGAGEAGDGLFEADARRELVARDICQELLVEVEAALGEGGVGAKEGAGGDGFVDEGAGFGVEGVVGEDVLKDFDLVEGGEGEVAGGVAGVLADADKGLEEDAGGRVAEAAEGELEVFGDVAAELGTEAADLVEEGAGNKDGGGPDGLAGEDAVVEGAAEDEVACGRGMRVSGGEEVGWEGAEFGGGRPGAVGDDAEVGKGELEVGVGEVEVELLLEFVGAPQVVVVAEGDPGGSAEVNAGVAGRGDAGVRLAVEADGRAEVFEGGVEGCGGAVVDDDDFGWGEGLGEDGRDGLAEEVGTVVGGDDDADGGHGGALPVRVTRGWGGEGRSLRIT